MKRLILASASERRRDLLKNIGADFDIITSDFDERKFINGQIAKKGSISPCEQAEMLALAKAKDVLSRTGDNDRVVIGADTMVAVDDKILGKPRDNDDAIAMLKLLSGKTHYVVTGLAAVSAKKCISCFEKTYVHMRDISDVEAANYVADEYVLDKAGAYAIQGKASLFIRGIEGCYFNVVGLPLFRLQQVLKEFDIDLI